MTDKCQCLAQYSFPTYFRNAPWYWVVYDVSSSGLISILFCQFLNDHNWWTGSRICAEMRSIPVIGVTSEYYLDSFWRANFTLKYKSSFHWVIFLAKADIMPSTWSNMPLCTVISWWRVTVCHSDIHSIQYRNGLNTSVTYLSLVHSPCVVQSGRYSLDFGILSNSQVNSCNR